MTKISPRREIADAGRKAAPVEHSALGSVQLDRIAAAGGPSSGGYGGGGNAVWPPPPGRN